MTFQPQDQNSEQRPPFAGIWALVCSVLCFLLLEPFGELVSLLVQREGFDGVPAWVIGLFVTFATMIPLGLLFLIWAFIIGGKYTRMLCIFFTFSGLLFIGGMVCGYW
jgi:hypothetical protein